MPGDSGVLVVTRVRSPDVPWAAANCVDASRAATASMERAISFGFSFEIASMREVGSHLLEPRWAGFVYAKSAGSLSFT
jgi:hypothetical protein